MRTDRDYMIERIGYGFLCVSVEEFVSRWDDWFRAYTESALYKCAFFDVIENPPELDDTSPFDQEDWDFEAAGCLGGFGSVYPQEYLALFEKLLKRQRTRSIALNSLWEVYYAGRLPILPFLQELTENFEQLDEEELVTLIDAIGCCTGKGGLKFLQRFRERISPEREDVMKQIDSYLMQSEQ